MIKNFLNKIIPKNELTGELLSGKPIDVHILNNYLPRIDQLPLKTLIRLRVYQTKEDIKMYSQPLSSKFNWKTIIIILAVIGILAFGIIMLLYGPKIMEALKGMMGGIIPK